MDSAGQNDYVSDDLKLVESEYEEICDVNQEWKKEKLPIFDKVCDPVENVSTKFPDESLPLHTNGVLPVKVEASSECDHADMKPVCCTEPNVQPMDGNLIMADRLLTQSDNGNNTQDVDLLHLSEFSDSKCKNDSDEILSSVKDSNIDSNHFVGDNDVQDTTVIQPSCPESPQSVGQGREQYINLVDIKSDAIVTEKCTNLSKSESSHSYEHLDPTTREDPSSSQNYEALIPVNSQESEPQLDQATDQSIVDS